MFKIRKKIKQFIDDTKGAELVQVVCLMAISLIVGGILMISTTKELGVNVEKLGNVMGDTYTYVEFENTKPEGGFGDSVAKANDAYNLNGLPPEKYAKRDETIFVYTHEKNGTIHSLTGAGNNIKFTATAAWDANDTITINGKNAKIYSETGERVEKYLLFVPNAIVTMRLVETGSGYDCYI